MKTINNYIYDNNYIGKGTFSKVYIGYKKHNSDYKYAIKKIYKKSDPKYIKYVNLEIEIMNKLNHKNIIKLYETIHTDKYVFLILELCETDLYTYINNNEINENDTRFIIKQIVEAIKYIMDNNIVHRDLKPHNILINKQSKVIKICDFGFAKEFKDTLMCDTICGSPLYMAPELLQNQKYNIKSDIWSIGIIMYEIVMKNHPFKSNNISDLIHKINNNKPILNSSKFSYECKELINNLLIVDYNKRLDWHELFTNKWIYDNLSIEESDNKDIIDNSINNELYLLFDNSNSMECNDMENYEYEKKYEYEEENEYEKKYEYDIEYEQQNKNEDKKKDIKNNNIGYDYIFVNKPVNKTVFNTLLDNSNEIINRIKKYI
jgi:serine/threonine protein kinase